jgi:hypothetical protein
MDTNNKSDIEMWINFQSLDDPTLHWPDFELAMLRIGRILTAKQDVRREIRAEYISKLMKKHRKEMPWVYTGREIREKFQPLGYLAGGGIQIEISELPFKYRGAPHYHFTFTKFYLREPQSQVQETNLLNGQAPTI